MWTPFYFKALSSCSLPPTAHPLLPQPIHFHPNQHYMVTVNISTESHRTTNRPLCISRSLVSSFIRALLHLLIQHIAPSWDCGGESGHIPGSGSLSRVEETDLKVKNFGQSRGHALQHTPCFIVNVLTFL